MKKKIVGITLLVMVLVCGVVFAVDQCKYYSTSPGGLKLAGLQARLSSDSNESRISVSSSIREPVKITSVQVKGKEKVWSVSGNKRLDAFGDTTLRINEKLSGPLIVEAESCD